MKKVGIFVGVAILLFLFYMIGPGCPQQAFLGISCPGCGMTRAYIQLIQGNIRSAFFYHPGFFLVPPALFLFWYQKKLSVRWFQVGISIILVLFISIYFYRMLHHDPVLICDIRQGYLYKIWQESFVNGIFAVCTILF